MATVGIVSIDTGRDRTLWIGSYTGEMGQGEGVSRLSPGASAPEPVGLDAPSPSWLVDVGTGVLAVSEADPGLVTRAGDDGETGAGQPTGSGWPCHAAVLSPTLLAVAHYGAGTVTALGLDEGRPGEVITTIDLSGRPLGPQADRQDGSHPHQVVLDETSGELLVPDLGADVVHRIPLRGTEIGPPEQDAVTMPPGFGPRHLVLTGDLMVVVGELSSQLWVGRRDDGAPSGWSAVGTTSTLLHPFDPAGSSDPDVGNLPSAIRLEGDVIAVGNRGADRVSLLRLDHATGTLSPITEVPAHGEWPRDLLLDGDDVWVACERAHRVTRVRWRGPEAGTLIASWETGSPTALLLR